MTYRVTSEWVGLKRNHPFPSIDFLNPKSFSVDWNSCILIRAVAGPARPIDEALEFEFVGKSFRKEAPGLTTGERLDAVPPDSLLSLSTPLMPMLFERRTAIIYSGILPWRGSKAVYFRSIAVPFGNSAGELTYALGAVSHKLTNDNLRPEQAQTEFTEFREGAWLPIDDAPELARATA